MNPGKQNCTLTFSPLEDVDYAFYNLGMFIKDVIIKRFIAKQITAKQFTAKPFEEYVVFQSFYLMITRSIFWNFLDIRLLEALALASMIPAAQKSVENYKRAFFNKKLSEAMRDYHQYQLFISFIGQRNEYLNENVIKNYDCHQMTIGDFHKHRLYLETCLFRVGEGTFAFTIFSVDPGSFYISWQIHIDLIHQVFCTLNDHKKAMQSIAYFSVDELERWRGLPVLLRGQHKEIGPIQSLEHRDKPYTLMKGYMWNKLEYNDIKEIFLLNEGHISYCLERFCRWVTLHPFFKKDFFIAVRSEVTHNPQLVGFSLCYPFTMQFGEITSLPVINLKNGMSLRYCNHQILNTMYKEAMRIANLYDISQAVLTHLPTRIIKPFARLSLWQFEFCLPLPRNNIQTPRWRKMKKKDITRALDLANKYTSQFEIRQVFKSKSEFSHYFLCPNIPDYISTYVVEDQQTGEITDMIGFRVEILTESLTCAYITAIISTRTPVRQLIADLLICAKQTKAQKLQTLQFGLKEEVFKDLHFFSWPHYRYWYPYNFSYPEIPESKVYVFGFY